ncbi:hypothetical protein HNY73_016951 [Argiope bruennichi]|uniref:Uncharacterized protein n=1 Tax=Argiope bruennichi TaxID=94029 RepID=A0A8T0EKH6_ARGBR|nr:hypothetical protein HNY73_016951 [Argiope bruennichi]
MSGANYGNVQLLWRLLRNVVGSLFGVAVRLLRNNLLPCFLSNGDKEDEDKQKFCNTCTCPGKRHHFGNNILRYGLIREI